MKICTLRSFTDPNKSYLITRKKKNGRINWSCSCKSDSMPCKHLKCLWGYNRHNSLYVLIESGFLSLTEKGKKFFDKDFDKRNLKDEKDILSSDRFLLYTSD
jgi:hypothetical protein